MTTDIANIWKYDLRKGKTDHPANGACLFDAGMWLVYGRVGDDPPCSCPVIRHYAIGLNDRMSDVERQRLKPFILRVVGNRDPSAERARLHFIVLETARRVVPLALAPRPEQQAALRALGDHASYGTIQKVCRDVRKDTARVYAAVVAAKAADAATADAGCAYWAAVVASAAANAAASAANDAASVWIEALAILDGALRIGKQSPEFDEAQVRESVRAFEFARTRWAQQTEQEPSGG